MQYGTNISLPIYVDIIVKIVIHALQVYYMQLLKASTKHI